MTLELIFLGSVSLRLLDTKIKLAQHSRLKGDHNFIYFDFQSTKKEKKIKWIVGFEPVSKFTLELYPDAANTAFCQTNSLPVKLTLRGYLALVCRQKKRQL